MKTLEKIMYKCLLVGILCCSLTGFAQNKTQKLKQSIKANDDVSIVVDSRHTNIIFETWNKNEVEIEAFLETKKSENQKEVLKNWHVEMDGNRSEIKITSTGSMGAPPLPPIPPTPIAMKGLEEIMAPMMENLMGPMMEEFAKNPLPPDFLENIGEMNFDYEAYEKDGEAYMKKWEKKVEGKLGADFEKKMEAWAESFEKDAEKWSKQMEADMEVWGEEFGAKMEKDMEAWGEKFGKEMEAWGEQFGKQFEAQMNGVNPEISKGDGKRTIIIRMPKKSILNLNVRHGEVKLAEVTTNLKATLSHGKLTGENINGEKTSIDVSYAPILVKNWVYGRLNTNYVKNCTIEKVESIKLNSTSSNILIQTLEKTGLLSGTFGNLTIKELEKDFETLNINLENSNLVLNIPEAAFNFSYNGSQSRIEYPQGLKVKPVKNYDNELLTGYYKSNNGDNTISIKAKFSEITVK
ncbi:MAG TPA: hypothetical protein VFM70_07520 [Salinimicrobium sp.]|nr:hypothetical protein [Salinimicrobium sp.]